MADTTKSPDNDGVNSQGKKNPLADRSMQSTRGIYVVLSGELD